MRIFRRHLAVVLGLICAVGRGAAAHAAASEAEAIDARGILAHGDLVLFTGLYTCRDQLAPPAAQMFVSRDYGKTWIKEGPAIDGGTFEYAFSDADGVWAAGRRETMSAQGDPFILIPRPPSSGDGTGTAPPSAWTRTTIFVGPAGLQGLGRQKNGDLLAWIRHPNAHDEYMWGPVVLHRSSDRGQTWSEAAARTSSKKAAGPMKKFDKLSTRSGDWRIAKRRDGGFDVQRKHGKVWQIVKEFPWQQCDAPPSSSFPPLPRTINLDSIGKIGRDPAPATPRSVPR